MSMSFPCICFQQELDIAYRGLRVNEGCLVFVAFSTTTVTRLRASHRATGFAVLPTLHFGARLFVEGGAVRDGWYSKREAA